MSDHEWGWCGKHEQPAVRYDDGSWGCWWEATVELNGYHDAGDFELRMPGYVRLDGVDVEGLRLLARGGWASDASATVKKVLAALAEGDTTNV